MNKNNKLTQFNEGGLHSQNPLGGIPLGNNNSVEEGETLKDNFVYSNQIFLDENTVSQYNLPKSLVGKSVADATKFIDNKFKGRNDKISQSTKDNMLSKIAEAQESMKPQDSNIDSQEVTNNTLEPIQMAAGGSFNPNGIISSVPGIIDLSKDFFGKSNIELDPNNIQDLSSIKIGNEISGGAVKGLSTGAQFGSSFGPLGTGIGAGVGALVGSIGGLIGGNKKQKAINRVNDKNAYLANNQYSDKYAMGGEINNIIDPNKSLQKIQSATNIDIVPPNDNLTFNTKKIVKYQPGVTSGNNGDSGFYLYNKLPTEQGFDPIKNREFVKNSNMTSVQRTPQWKEYISSQNIQSKQLAKGGKLTPLDISLNSNPLENPTFELPSFSTDKMIADLSKPMNTEKPSLSNYLNYGVNEVGNFLNKNLKSTNLGNLARYAPIATNAYQLSKLKKPQGERLDRLTNRYRPEYVDETTLQNIANNTMNNSINALSESGASQGQIRSSIIGSQLQRTKALSDAYNSAEAQNRTTNDRAQTFNLGVDQVNLNQSNTEKDINARDQAAYRNAKREYITGIGEGIGDIGKEQTQKKIIAKTLGYKWDGEYVKSPDGTVVTDPDTGKPMTQEKLKEIQSTKDKKALGGYLIKNKTK